MLCLHVHVKHTDSSPDPVIPSHIVEIFGIMHGFVICLCFINIQVTATEKKDYRKSEEKTKLLNNSGERIAK